jgi:hypothetical protein
VDRSDVLPQLRTNDREVLQRRAEQRLLQSGIVLQRETQQAHQQQQQRKQRDETVIRDQRGQIAALVVDELVDHPQREAQPGMTPLEVIQSSRYAHVLQSSPSGHRRTP